MSQLRSRHTSVRIRQVLLFVAEHDDSWRPVGGIVDGSGPAGESIARSDSTLPDYAIEAATGAQCGLDGTSVERSGMPGTVDGGALRGEVILEGNNAGGDLGVL